MCTECASQNARGVRLPLLIHTMWSCESTAGTFPQSACCRFLEPGFQLKDPEGGFVTSECEVELLHAIRAPSAQRVGAGGRRRDGVPLAPALLQGAAQVQRSGAQPSLLGPRAWRERLHRQHAEQRLESGDRAGAAIVDALCAFQHQRRRHRLEVQAKAIRRTPQAADRVARGCDHAPDPGGLRAIWILGMRCRRHPERRQQPAHSQRSEEHTSELQSRRELVCRLLLEKKKKKIKKNVKKKKKNKKKNRTI